MQKQWQLIKQFVLPADLKDGIVYLQRALRDCVVQHQVLASKINILPMNQRAKVKEYMLELEREMLSIGQEQEGLVRQMSERVKRFQLNIQSRKMICLADELLFGYVSSVLHTHHETANTKTPPKHISPRLNAAELSQKYCLDAILVKPEAVLKEEPLLHDDFDDDSNAPDRWVDEEQPKPKHAKKLTGKTYHKPTSTPAVPTNASSRSLLKPKEERQKASTTVVARPFAGIADGKTEPTASRRRSVGVKKEEEEKAETVDTARPEKSSDEERDEDDEEGESEPTPGRPRGRPPKQPGVVAIRRARAWMPGLRGRPPKGVKYVSAAKLAAQEVQRQQQNANAERRASKRKETLKEKVIEPPPVLEELEDSGEEQSAPQLATSAAVRRGRSNLLQALNRQKRPVGRPILEQAAPHQQQRVGGSRREPSTSGGAKLIKHGSSGSSGSSPNSRSSTPTWGLMRQPSDDSCDRRSSSGEFPPFADAGEPPVPTPLSIFELEQATYLRFFGLYTPSELEAMRERKRVRKRRSCYSTERKDFHYGKLDYYEQQQQQYQVVRASKRTHQRPILYSPPVAVAKKRKHPPVAHVLLQSQVGTASGSSERSVGRPRLPPSNIFAAMDNRCCFVCFKTGSTDELSACINCCNIYHLNCHKIDEEADAHRQRDNLCPVCLVDDGDKQLSD